MIVFDLKCGAEHVFEAWFASSDAYADQRARRLISCPFCGSSDVTKAVMAPNVSAKGNRATPVAPVPIASGAGDEPAQMQKMLETLAKAQSEMLTKSKWVGRDFDKKARAMDAGEIDHATIHGEVTRAEADALIDDEIAVLPLPFPVVPPSKRN
jgi:hypothetical protein